jgi:hypothetical protein
VRLLSYLLVAPFLCYLSHNTAGLFIGLLQDGLMKASKKKFEVVMAAYGKILMNEA